jgi:hypothetical protein
LTLGFIFLPSHKKRSHGAQSYKHRKQIEVWLGYLPSNDSYYLWDLQIETSGKAKTYLQNLKEQIQYFGKICKLVGEREIGGRNIDALIFDWYMSYFNF